jgi:hypothetical protein
MNVFVLKVATMRKEIKEGRLSYFLVNPKEALD